nr:SDR family oxidoreductase [Arthrobacter ulcerisalmonis]
MVIGSAAARASLTGCPLAAGPNSSPHRGGLDALVANAGIASPGAICDVSIEDWDYMFSVNLRGAWLLAKASHPHLRQSRGSACFTSDRVPCKPPSGLSHRAGHLS